MIPDGTVIWTAPTGHTYTTYPGSTHLFPKLCKPTSTRWPGEPHAAGAFLDRGVMMPKRRHTRAHNTAKAIAAERRLNESYAATVSEFGNSHESWPRGVQVRRARTTHHPFRAAGYSGV